jgi:hypothetical protein
MAFFIERKYQRQNYLLAQYSVVKSVKPSVKCGGMDFNKLCHLFSSEINTYFIHQF